MQLSVSHKLFYLKKSMCTSLHAQYKDSLTSSSFLLMALCYELFMEEWLGPQPLSVGPSFSVSSTLAGGFFRRDYLPTVMIPGIISYPSGYD